MATRWAVLTVAAVLLLSVTVVAAGVGSVIGPTASESMAGAMPTDRQNPCVGTNERRPANTTLLSIQGFHDGQKRAAMVVGIRPDGAISGVHNTSANGRVWAYDVDPLSDETVLLSTTEPGVSFVEKIHLETGEHVSVRRFPDVLDSHDVDRISDDELLLNDMSQDGEARIFVYNTTRGAVTWEYRFADHPEQFPHAGGGEFGGDWTHNNDVEQVDDGVFMVSVRNFDQVVAIDRETKEIVWKLDADDDRDVLFEQHNPDYIESENGTPTVLVADSENDRVVEYARIDGAWERTWVLRGGGLAEPRDADRLPNGNTLVVDRFGHRLLEVTPQGQVVWEMYAPWQPYDAERLGTGDESSGPTMRAVGATGTHALTGSQGVDDRRAAACYDYLTAGERGNTLAPTEPARNTASPTAVVRESPEVDSSEPDDSPVTTGVEAPGPVAFVAGVLLGLLAVIGVVKVARV